MERRTLHSLSAAALPGGAQRMTLEGASLAIAIVLLNAGGVQAAGFDNDVEPRSLREQVRKLTSETDAGWHQHTPAGNRTLANGQTLDPTRDASPSLDTQPARMRELRFGAGYETRMRAQPQQRWK